MIQQLHANCTQRLFQLIYLLGYQKKRGQKPSAAPGQEALVRGHRLLPAHLGAALQKEPEGLDRHKLSMSQQHVLAVALWTC